MPRGRCPAGAVQVVDDKGKVWYTKRHYDEVHGEVRNIRIYDENCNLVEDYKGLLSSYQVEHKIKNGSWWKIKRQDRRIRK